MLSNWKEYDRGDNFLSNYEPNEISFDTKSKGKTFTRSYSNCNSNIIVVTVFFPIINQTESRLVQNQKEKLSLQSYHHVSLYAAGTEIYLRSLSNWNSNMIVVTVFPYDFVLNGISFGL